MKASWQITRLNGETKLVTNSVTNPLGNPGQCRATVTNSVTKLRAIQGNEITTFGDLGQWRGTEGNGSFGLITQRSEFKSFLRNQTSSLLPTIS